MKPIDRAETHTAVRLLQAALTVAGLAFVAGGIRLVWTRGAESPPELPGSTSGASGDAWFVDVAPSRGVDFRHVSGADNRSLYMPEIMAGGAALFDYDRDGWLDVYFVQSGRLVGADGNLPGNRLFRNTGRGGFLEVTDSAGVGDTGYGMGAACGDFDNDGWTDLYVTNVGPNVLYRNNGDGTFSDVTSAAGVGDRGFSSSAAFVDYDHDGDLDLLVVNYIRWSPEGEVDCTSATGVREYCTPNAYNAPAPDTLYRNNGDGTFTDATKASGLSENFGNGLGVVCGDFSGDGLVDLAVANDLLANQLWVNRGEGAFRDESLQRGAAYNGDGMAEAGMGIDGRDVDHDGDLDLFMTHFNAQTNTLYINEGGTLVDRTTQFSLGASLPFTGFGTGIVDFNNDGRLDIYVANGRVHRSHSGHQTDGPYDEPNQLFEGLADGTFREVMPRGGTASLLSHASRGAAFGDFDNDGDVDIFVMNKDAPAYLLENRAAAGNHWIAFQVLNRYGSDAIGARVIITVDGRTFVRDVRAAYSYCTSNDPRVYFGLGEAVSVDAVEVVWPDGATRALGPRRADRIIRVSPSGESGT